MKRTQLLFLLLLPISSLSAAEYTVQQGFLDLTGYNEDSDLLSLDGNWDFAEGVWIDPADKDFNWSDTANVPGNIRFGRRRLGLGSYHLEIKTGQEGLYALYLREISSACRVYLNGEEIFSSGKLGQDRKSEIKDNNELLYPLQLEEGSTLDLVVHFSNFSSNTSGIVKSPLFGSYLALNRLRQKELLLLLGIIGSFLMIGFYHFTLFLFRRKERASLYFSLLTLFFAFRIFFSRIMGVSDIFPFFDAIPFVLFKRFGYLNVYAAFIAFCFLYSALFNQELYRKLARFALFLSLVLSLPIMIAPFSFFSRFVLIHDFFIVAYGLYYFIDLIIRSLKKEIDAMIFLTGYLLFFVTVVLDIVNDAIGSSFLPITHMGFMLLITFQSVLLSRRYSQAYTSTEGLTRELNRLFQERQSYEKLLESRVEERTEALRLATDEAEVANQAKGEFLARMSHEIRTPLNGIMGFGEIISEMDNEEEEEKYSSLIISESEKLLELINQLLDLSKIDSGEVVLEIRPTDLDVFFHSIITLFSPRITSAGLDFYRNVPEFDCLVLCDPFRLRQVMVNLLGNALKFTKAGSIQLDVDIIKETEGQLDLMIVVSDTGIGIDLKSQDRIFEEFQQADSSITRKYGGTGLGTTIARSMVEKMGGEIGVKSRLGEGSSFWFLLSLKKLEKPETFSQVHLIDYSYDQMNLRVLIIDDSETNRQVAAHHLEEVGCSVDHASSGEEGLDAFRNNQYDLVFMDVHMPEMDGYEATRLLRKLPGGDVVIILGLTADAFNETKVQCLQSGMNDVLTKPLRKKKFLQTVGRWMGEEGKLEIGDL